MPKRYYINAKQVKELKAAKQKNKDKNADRRLLLLLLHAQGEKREEIALRSGYAVSSISGIVSKYCNEGLEAIVVDHRHSNCWNMTFEEEAAFLEPYIKAAEAGQMTSVKEIRIAYEKKIGRELKSKGHIYKLLKRHGWRRVMPRGKHPKQADEATQEASKKLTIP